MGKGKRIREAKANETLRMSRGEFKAFLLTVMGNADDASYWGLQKIILMACGVIGEDGKLTEQYAESPFWAVKDGYIVPSEHTKLIGELTNPKQHGDFKPCKHCGAQPAYKVNGRGWQQLTCKCGRSTAFFEDKEEAEASWDASNGDGE